MPETRTRLSAEQRREQVLDTAMAVFARHGYEGTSTEDVAKAAGISQPYLFRLFATKKALFIALLERCFARVATAFAEAAAGQRSEDALHAMGLAYGELLADRDLLLMQLHSYAACDDPEIRASTRRCFTELWKHVSVLSGASSELITDFFAHGMLLNVIAAMDATELGEEWVHACLSLREN